jgi:type II secretory ATPase GspE/PulE/Tfp pilus assembly ATPase PilB-like protein
MTKRLGDILIDQGQIDAQKLDFALKVQKNNGGERIGRVLKHYGFISEDQIAKALAKQAGWTIYEGSFEPHIATIDMFGLDFLIKRCVLPVDQNGEVIFIMSRCDDMATTDLIQSRLNKSKFMIAPESLLRQALEKLSGQKIGESQDDIDIVSWFDILMNKAASSFTTDIHIEASQKAVEVRFRIDGILCFVDSLRLNKLPRLVNIIFHKADVTVSDFNHFHDARFTHQYLGKQIDVRVSYIPAVHGSSLVLRLLDKSKTAIALTSLGFGPQQWEIIENGLKKPEGITLIVGPTGCGKTTTLYAMLNHLKSITKKIVTIEDPVEMHQPLMTQVQTNEKRQITFGQAVRAFLRHDPNIILIGEIRDRETAGEALRAAMTGHKVFATLHANRPVDAILRLNDLGVPYTHLAGNLTMVITQRLVRCLNKNGELKGRTVVAEILSVDCDIEDFICRGDIAGLRKHIKQNNNYITLGQDAQRLIDSAITSQEEVERVIG